MTQSNDNSLMAFRLAFLRAIARSWHDQDFRVKLRDQPQEALQDCGLPNWNWWLEPIFKLEGVIWSPELTGGWRGSEAAGERKRESITLRLPLNPERALPGVKTELWSQALAEYYRCFPTLLGPCSLAPQETAAGFGSGLGSDCISSTQTPPRSGAGLWNWSDFLAFGGVTMRAIAMAWKDAEFRDLLVHDTRNTLENWLAFTSPWNLELKIEDAPNTTWNEGTTGVLGTGWTLQDRHDLVLFIPQNPKQDDGTIWPIALAAYNETGPAYPFTCCT